MSRISLAILLALCFVFIAAGEVDGPKLTELEALKTQNRLKDLQLAQKDFDILYQQFLALESVKKAQGVIQQRQNELVALEQDILAERKLDRKDWFIDFSAGLLKPVVPEIRPTTSSISGPR